MGKGLRRSANNAATILLVALCAGLFLKGLVVDACRIASPSMEPSLAPGDDLLFTKLPYSLPRAVTRALLLALGVPPFDSPLLCSPRRGDILVFDYLARGASHAGSGTELYVKRCIGLPGDTVRILQGKLLVNGAIVRRLRTSERCPDFGPYVVPRKGDAIPLTLSTIMAWQPLLLREGHTVAVDDGGVRVDGSPATTYAVAKNYLFVLGDNLTDSFDSRSWGPLAEDQVVGKGILLYWSRDPESDGNGFWQRLAETRWTRMGVIVH